MENKSKNNSGILIKGGKQPANPPAAPTAVGQPPKPPAESGTSSSK
ncbi:MAG: hypothetical protein WDO06_04280 [Actinomycetota bacterium]